MTKWLDLGTMCTNCQITQFDSLIDFLQRKPMYPKLSLIIICTISLSLAVILAFVPNFTSLWIHTHNLMTKFSFSGHSHSVNSGPSSVSNKLHSDFKFDLCSRDFTIRNPKISTIDNLDLTVEGVAPTLRSYSVERSKTRKPSDLHGEALASLHLAKDMSSQGKTEKALKLFQHAIALSPFHPDILTEYGEFLENQQNDIVLAEHLYCRALISSPSHSKALVNRKRTLPLVEEIDQNYYNGIDHKRKLLLGIPENHPGVRRMMQESYYKHIHHTTALEGNTFTLSQTRMLVENRLAIGGKSLLEHNEIIGMDSAFTFVNNSLIDRLGKLTLHDIKSIHKRVLGHVDPVGAGEFRTTQVAVGDHSPPDPSEVPQLMEEFIEWLNSEEALSLHAIELAALAHYKFVWIHPFYDGNGRTSRLLMNMILMQAGYPPIIIKVEEKLIYYENLQTGNNGDIRPFIRFIALCTERAIDEYLMAGLENARSLVSQLQLKPFDDGRTIIIDNDDQNIP